VVNKIDNYRFDYSAIPTVLLVPSVIDANETSGIVNVA
jgi:hypothetical protein